MCMSVHYISKYNLLTCMRLLGYVFSGLIVWYQIVSALERTVSHFEHSLVVCGTWCSVEDPWPTYSPPSTLACLLVLTLFISS